MKKQKIFDIVATVLAILAVLLAAAAIWTVLTTQKGQAPQLGGMSILRVVSGSMEPKIPERSVAFVKRTDPADLKVGDVISFYSNDPAIKGEINTHRVAEIGKQNGRRYFITKGDANSIRDPYTVYEEDVIGRVVFSSVLFGWFVNIAAGKFGYVFLVLIPLLFIVIFNIGDIIHIIRREANEEVRRELETEMRRQAKAARDPETETHRQAKAAGEPETETHRQAKTAGDPETEMRRQAKTSGDPETEMRRQAKASGDPETEMRRQAKASGDPETEMRRQAKAAGDPETEMRRRKEAGTQAGARE